jgi:glycosyltransferase involved in cell wall biosynthesis
MCVVVPSFNNVAEDRYIYNIESILSQNYTNFFVIIVDDFSADNTGAFIKKYLKDKNVPSEKVTVAIRS